MENAFLASCVHCSGGHSNFLLNRVADAWASAGGSAAGAVLCAGSTLLREPLSLSHAGSRTPSPRKEGKGRGWAAAIAVWGRLRLLAFDGVDVVSVMGLLDRWTEGDGEKHGDDGSAARQGKGAGLGGVGVMGSIFDQSPM